MCLLGSSQPLLSSDGTKAPTLKAKTATFKTKAKAFNTLNIEVKVHIRAPPQTASEVTEIGRISVVMHVSY